jgi:MoaA/NifB/PqqE/SkfB family radical SAM enzyme
MHPDIWSLCALLKNLPARVTLLSTGQTLARHAETASALCDEVIVSLDGSPTVHDAIRGIPDAFQKLQDGITALRHHRPDFSISARCVLQKRNFRDLANIVTAARGLALDRISFMAADLSSTAFNRPNGWDDEHTDAVCLSSEESLEFADIIEQLIAHNAEDFTTGFISERPDRLRGLGHYYQAVHGIRPFPPIRCTAPWVSTVIETDGTVRPCFFHTAFGNVNDRPLNTILNSEEAIAFREGLDVRSNPICQRCVCTFNM